MCASFPERLKAFAIAAVSSPFPSAGSCQSRNAKIIEARKAAERRQAYCVISAGIGHPIAFAYSAANSWLDGNSSFNS
jgi:hypothetical protein